MSAHHIDTGRQKCQKPGHASKPRFVLPSWVLKLPKKRSEEAAPDAPCRDGGLQLEKDLGFWGLRLAIEFC